MDKVALIPDKKQSHDVIVGLGLLLRAADGSFMVNKYVGWQDYGTFCSCSDGMSRKVCRRWNPDAYKYEYWTSEERPGV